MLIDLLVHAAARPLLLDANYTLSLELGPLGPEVRRKRPLPYRDSPYASNSIIVRSQDQISKTCVEPCFRKVPSVSIEGRYEKMSTVRCLSLQPSEPYSIVSHGPIKNPAQAMEPPPEQCSSRNIPLCLVACLKRYRYHTKALLSYKVLSASILREISFPLMLRINVPLQRGWFVFTS